VSKAGKITGVFRDADAHRPTQQPALEAALQELRFNPALDNGRPAEGIASLPLGSLAAR
jgi:hypothetical protein